MMKYPIILLRAAFLFLPLLATSCGKDEQEEETLPPDALQLESISVRGNTGGDGYPFVQGQQLILSLDYGERDRQTTTLTYNESSGKGQWSCSPVILWKQNHNEVGLLAYSAGNESFELPAEPDKDSYLSEDRLRYRGNILPANPLSLQLEHAMSQLKVVLAAGTDMSDTELANATVTINNAPVHARVNTEDGSVSVDGSKSETKAITLYRPDEAVKAYHTLLIPGQELTPEISITANGQKHTYQATIPITPGAGTICEYQLTVSRTGVSGIAAEVEDWTGGDTSHEAELLSKTIAVSAGGMETALNAMNDQDKLCKKLVFTGAMNDSDFQALKSYVNQNKIRLIVLPDNITTIPAYAFNDCSSLQTIDLKQVQTIGAYAFFRSGLTEVSIPNTVTSWDMRSFGECASLKEVTIETTTPGSLQVFFNCGAIKTIHINADISGAYNAPFLGVENNERIIYIGDKVTTLRNIGWGTRVTAIIPEGTADTGIKPGVISLPKTVTAIANNCFKDAALLTTIESWGNVTSIGEYAFSGSGITTIKIPTSSTQFAGAFQDCKYLKAVDLNGNTTIPENDFRGCTALTDIDLSKVTSIGNAAFYGCTALTDIDLSKVTSIGASAFNGCSKLTATTLDAAIENAGIDKIGEGAFANTGITTFTYPETCTSTGNLFRGHKGLTNVILTDNITTIPIYAFNDCSSLQTIDLKKVQTIDTYAFFGSGLTEVTIPETMINWGMEIFGGCASLKEVTIETTAPGGQEAFLNCGAIKTIHINADISGAYNQPFSGVENNERIIYIGDKVTTLRNMGWGTGVTSFIIEGSRTPTAITCADSPFKDTPNAALFLPDQSTLAEGWKTWGMTWKNIHYGYKGAGDKTDSNSYNGHYSAP